MMDAHPDLIKLSDQTARDLARLHRGRRIFWSLVLLIPAAGLVAAVIAAWRTF